MAKLTLVICGLLVLFSPSCDGEKVCYAHSSTEVEECEREGKYADIYVYSATEETMRFSTMSNIGIWIDANNNPLVRRVEADGPGRVTTNNIDEIVLTHTNCRGNYVGAKLVDLTIDQQDDGFFCDVYPEPGSTARLAAEEGTSIGYLRTSARESWDDVTLEVDASARPTETLNSGDVPLEVLQQFGSQMKLVELSVMDDAVLNSYFDWLDSEGYGGTVSLFVDSAGEYQQVYPRAE